MIRMKTHCEPDAGLTGLFTLWYLMLKHIYHVGTIVMCKTGTLSSQDEHMRRITAETRI